MAHAEQLIRELERTRDETLQRFTLSDRDLARTYGPGKWSIRYILHHLADSETVFLDRISRVLSDPRPVLLVMDQEAWARALDYATKPLDRPFSPVSKCPDEAMARIRLEDFLPGEVLEHIPIDRTTYWA